MMDETRADAPPSVPDRTGERLSPADWIAAARVELVASGVGAVKIDRIAAGLGVTRGSFYWHFQSREALLRALLSDWQAENTGCFREAVSVPGDETLMKLVRYCRVWLDPGVFDAAYDAAVRDWARADPAVVPLVRAADDERIAILHAALVDLGYADPEAMVRARAVYYHQIGYFALRIEEDLATREALFPVYFEVLFGFPLPPALGARAREAPAL
jgi:AcrR family transcriptional regulator